MMRIRLDRNAVDSPRLAGIAAALFGMLLFAQSIPYAYVMDDVPVIAQDQRLRDPRFCTKLWTVPWVMGTPVTSNRPLTTFTFWAQVQSNAHSPPASRVINIGLFGILTFLVSILAGKWLPEPSGAWLVGMLFAAHPIHIEAVVNIVGRAELLSGMFLVVGLIYWQKWRENLTIRRSVLIALLVLLAGLSKETGYLLAPMIVLGEIAARRVEGKRIFGSPYLIPLATCIFLVAGLAFVQREIVTRKNADYLVKNDIVPKVHHDDNPLVTSDPVERIVSVALILGKTALCLVVPFNQSPDYSTQMLMPSKNLGDPHVLAGLGVLVLWAVGLTESWKRRLPALGPLLLLAPAWVVPSNTVVLIGEIFAERWLTILSILLPIAIVSLYQSRALSKNLVMAQIWIVGGVTLLLLPCTLLYYCRYSLVSIQEFLAIKLAFSAGILLLGLLTFSDYVRNKPVRATILVVLLFYSWSTLTYMPVWRDWPTLAITTAERHPNNGAFQGHASIQLLIRSMSEMRRGDVMQSLAYLELAKRTATAAIELRQAQRDPYITLACVAQYRGDRRKARRHFSQFLDQGGDFREYQQLLAEFKLDRTIIAEALAESLERQAKQEPHRWDLWATAARALLAANGDRAKSRECIRKALDLRPDDASLWAILSRWYESGKPPDINRAIQAIEKAGDLAAGHDPNRQQYIDELNRLRSLP